MLTIGEGEAAKTLATVEDLCRAFARWGLTRGDVRRRPSAAAWSPTWPASPPPSTTGASPVVHVPTTLLGQVDAAIGGKTGVNLPEGKNLVGAFWQPAAVLCDTDVLATLPRAGVPVAASARWPSTTSSAGDDLARPAARRAGRRVRRASRPTVVAVDRRAATAAGGPSSTTATPSATPSRSAGRYDLRHGEAVAIGLVFAAELARRLGRIDAGRVAEHRAVVAAYGPPTPRCRRGSTTTSCWR